MKMKARNPKRSALSSVNSHSKIYLPKLKPQKTKWKHFFPTSYRKIVLHGAALLIVAFLTAYGLYSNVWARPLVERNTPPRPEEQEEGPLPSSSQQRPQGKLSFQADVAAAVVATTAAASSPTVPVCMLQIRNACNTNKNVIHWG